MNRLLLLFFLTISLSGFSQTQSEMSSEAAESYQEADKELNSTYKKVLQKYKSDTVFVDNLKIAQRIWIKFRDAELELKYPHREAGYYGSVLPMCKSLYLKGLTEIRTKTLTEFLNIRQKL